MERIIYPTDQGGVAVIIPNLDCGLSAEQIAQKDVPTGCPYWIVFTSSVPVDRAARELWAIDQETAGEPHGYGA